MLLQANALAVNDKFRLPRKRIYQVVRKVFPITHHETGKPALLVIVDNCKQIVLNPDQKVERFDPEPEAPDASAS